MVETMRFGWSEEEVERAAGLLRQGEVVAFPTETVYGLGANAFDRSAVDKIFQAKGRPSDNPLIVHIADMADVEKLVERVPAHARRLMEHFWPGPLTLVLPAKASIPANVTAGLDTVGVRMPDHETALGLIQAAGVPLAAPSANRSGRPSPTAADHVLEDLAGRIAGVVDGGPSSVGVESTVLDCTGDVPMILRPGSVTAEMLRDVIGEVSTDPALAGQGAPRSPGVKYTHYAPKGEMHLVQGARAVDVIEELAMKAIRAGLRVGILTTAEGEGQYQTLVQAAERVYVLPVGRRSDLSTVATGLYDAIRAFDRYDADVIYAETFPETGTGVAIMNRLRKAAGHRVIAAD
ncbi:L-threonylcarbamoyladenylate synthase [Tumebacillus sp. DT12]|uniref:Threonylcarbamoyl-AMP synthase n=1 Tax=Tumebacillus lacus TaxID=2995335 RepID=A0ABT3WY55_9BACL|nr:L-threonylcarbamoyladenylate synthase [Tumebacillus lacus]MCX7569566.1 L-threonylcarbamoyladenylate synthase [Tumebacillus lacus]